LNLIASTVNMSIILLESSNSCKSWESSCSSFQWSTPKSANLKGNSLYDLCWER